MASRSLSKALRAPLARSLAAPGLQQRSYTVARNLARATATAARPAVAQHQVRGIKTIDFAGVKEDVYGTRSLSPLAIPPILTCPPRTCRLAAGEAPRESLPPPNAQLLTNCSPKDYFKDDTLALIGYGSQGHGQGLNLRDNGLNVIVGVRKNGKSWKDAQQDGWVPGKNLFDVDEAISRGTIVMNLLSDAAQSETWPAIKPQLTEGKVRRVAAYLCSSR